MYAHLLFEIINSDILCTIGQFGRWTPGQLDAWTAGQLDDHRDARSQALYHIVEASCALSAQLFAEFAGSKTGRDKMFRA